MNLLWIEHLNTQHGYPGRPGGNGSAGDAPSYKQALDRLGALKLAVSPPLEASNDHSSFDEELSRDDNVGFVARGKSDCSTSGPGHPLNQGPLQGHLTRKGCNSDRSRELARAPVDRMFPLMRTGSLRCQPALMSAHGLLRQSSARVRRGPCVARAAAVQGRVAHHRSRNCMTAKKSAPAKAAKPAPKPSTTEANNKRKTVKTATSPQPRPAPAKVDREGRRQGRRQARRSSPKRRANQAVRRSPA